MRITLRLGRRSEAAISYQLSALSYPLSAKKITETGVTITLNHFSAAAVFALFASIVFGITHREDTRDMVRYGLYCFAMFLGGVLVAGWAMWVLRR
jgi:vacuolar-type H+-ATPase catalytic subunit A/Vma1